MNKRTRTGNSIRNLSTSLITQFLLTAMRFVCRTVFINTLGKSYLGINGLFSDILTMLSLTELGLDTAINYKLYKPIADGDQHRVRILIKFYRYAYLIVGAIILTTGLLIIPLLPHLIKDYDTLLSLEINPALIFLMFLMQSVSSYWFFAHCSAVIKADQQEYILTLVSFIMQLLMNITQIITLMFWQNFIIYTALSIAFSIVTNIFCAIIARKKYSYAFEKTEDNISKDEVKDLFKDLGALFVYKINTVVIKATDNLVLSTFMGLAIVGVYSNYLLIYSTLKTFLWKFYSAIRASAGNLYAKERVEKQYLFFETMNYLTMIIYGTACIGVALVTNELLKTWIGDNYTIAQPFAVLIGIEILFSGLKNNLGQIRQVAGLFRQMWYRPLLGILINLTVSIIGVNILGIYGVIIGTIVADLLANFMIDPRILYKYLFKEYRSVKCYYSKNIRYILLLGIIGILDYWLCKIIFPEHGLLSIVLHMFICVITVPIGFILVYHKSDENKYLTNLLYRTIVKINSKF